MFYRVSNGGTETILSNCAFNKSTQSGYPSTVYYDTGISNCVGVGILGGKTYMVIQSSGNRCDYTDYSVSISSTGRVTLTSNVSGVGFFLLASAPNYVTTLKLIILH